MVTGETVSAGKGDGLPAAPPDRGWRLVAANRRNEGARTRRRELVPCATAGASSAAFWSSGGHIDTLGRTASPPVNSPCQTKSLGNCDFSAVLIQVKALVSDLWELVLYAHQRGIRPFAPEAPGH
jgi:hypothetical protein